MNSLELFDRSAEGILTPKLTKGHRFLFVGRSGSGKSNALMSFPGPLYDFDCDNRFKGAVTAIKWLGEETFKNIDFDYFNPKDGFEAVDDKFNKIANEIVGGKGKYNTLAIESVGTLMTMLALDSQKKRGIKGDGFMKGKVRGKVEFLIPDDYNYISTAMRLIQYNYVFPLCEMGINVVFTAWPIDKWGKRPGAGPYESAEVIGEKLLGPGNAVEECVGYFDECYYFYKDPPLISTQMPKFSVEFTGSLAKTCYGLPAGKHDITNKNFYVLWTEMVEKSLNTKENT